MWWLENLMLMSDSEVKFQDRLGEDERRVRKVEMIYKEGKGGSERKDKIE